jgi:hypothetical protein
MTEDEALKALDAPKPNRDAESTARRAKNQIVAYRQAERALRQLHRDEFDTLREAAFQRLENGHS